MAKKVMGYINSKGEFVPGDPVIKAAVDFQNKINNKTQNSMTTYKILLAYDISMGNNTQADKNRYQTVINNLYQWLDGLDAEECTYSVARFSKLANDFAGVKIFLTRELGNIGVDVKKGDRIYVEISEPIALHIPGGNSMVVDMVHFAGFIFGVRHKAPWENDAKGHYDNIDINVPLK